MSTSLKSRISALLGASPIGLIPVRIRGGIAKGARWTLLPHSAYWRGIGERDVEAVIGRLGDLRGACCWDLGAHFGIYTVGLARAVGATGQIASFEPDPRSHARCARHVRMNGLLNVRLFQAAVGDRAAQDLLIVTGGLGSTGNHLRYEDEAKQSTERSIKIETVQLDQLVERNEIRPPRFAKIDVEGHGGKALQGARTTLEYHRPLLVMSFHSEFELASSRAVLEPIGYRACDPITQAPWEWSTCLYRTALLQSD